MRRLVTIGLALVALTLAAQPALAGRISVIFSKTDSIYGRIGYPGLTIAGHHFADSTVSKSPNFSRYWAEFVQLSNPNGGGTDTTCRFAIQMRSRDPIYSTNDTLATGIGMRKLLIATGASANPPADSMTVSTIYYGGTDSTLAWNELGAFASYVPTTRAGATISRVARVDFEDAVTHRPWLAYQPEFVWRILASYRAAQFPIVAWYRIVIYGYAE
jgi:hypothetical protein